jgi:hypothetical protein
MRILNPDLFHFPFRVAHPELWCWWLYFWMFRAHRRNTLRFQMCTTLDCRASVYDGGLRDVEGVALVRTRSESLVVASVIASLRLVWFRKRLQIDPNLRHGRANPISLFRRTRFGYFRNRTYKDLSGYSDQWAVNTPDMIQ